MHEQKVDTLVVDKTGTLTEGKPKLMSVVPVSGFDEQTPLRLAATLERGSESSRSSTTRQEYRSRLGVLYPFLGLLLSPIIAAAAMSFSSMSVVGNALRLRRPDV